MQAIPISKIFPINRIGKDYMLSGNGDITFGWELMLPEVFSLSETDYDKLWSHLVRAMRKMNAGTVIHFQQFYYTGRYDEARETTNYWLRNNHRDLLGRPVCRHFCRVFVSFNHKPLETLSQHQNPVNRLFEYLKRNPFKGYEAFLEQARLRAKTFESSLSGFRQLQCVRLTENKLYDALWQYWGQRYNTEPVFRDHSIPPIQTRDGFFRIGERCIGIMSLVNQGQTVSQVKNQQDFDAGELSEAEVEKDFDLNLGSMFTLGLGLPFNHIVNTIITIGDKEKWKFNFAWKEKPFTAFLAGIGNDEAAEKLEDAEGFFDAVTKRDYRVARCAVNVIVMDKGEELLKEKLEKVSEAFEKTESSVKLWAENRESLMLFAGSSPGFGRGNFRAFKTCVEHAACYIPLETHYLGDMTGDLFLDRFGNPFYLDLWDNGIVNRNACVAGPTGSGKSNFVKARVLEDLDKNMLVTILDVGHSYKELCEVMDGRYLDSDDPAAMQFAPFLCALNEQGEYEPDADKKIFLSSLLLAAWKGADTQSVKRSYLSVLKDLIQYFYQQVNGQQAFPDFHFFYSCIDPFTRQFEGSKHLFDFEDFKQVLKPFDSGDYAHLFNGRQNHDLSGQQLVVFDIKAASNDRYIYPAVGIMIIETALEQIRQHPGRRKKFYIDEGWKVLAGEMKEFVEYLFRTYRKEQGGVWLLSQNVNDFENIGEGAGDALLANFDTQVALYHNNKAQQLLPDLQRIFHLTDFEIQLVKNIKIQDERGYREAFLKMGPRSLLVRNRYSQKTQAVFTSKGDEKTEIRALFKKLGSMQAAINQYIENKYKSAVKAD